MFLTSLFYKDPPPPYIYLPSPLFNFCPTPLLYCLQPPHLLLFLLSCFFGVFFGSMGDCIIFDVPLNDTMDLHMSNLEPCCVFYAIRHQVYSDLTPVVCWYSHLISHTHTHMHTHTHTHTHTHRYTAHTDTLHTQGPID